MDAATQEWAIGLGGGLIVAGGVLYFLDQQGIIHIPIPGVKSQGPHVAPPNLPSHVTRRCGTVYVSFGTSTAQPHDIIVGKYTNGKLVTQYYQKASLHPGFDKAGTYGGGSHCHTSTHHTSTPHKSQTTTPHKSKTSTPHARSTLASKAAHYRWTAVGGGAYVAESGATLSGLSVVTGIPYTTLTRYNCLKTSSVILVGKKIFTTQQTCQQASKTPQKSQKTVTESDCTTLIMKKGFTYGIADRGSSLPCVVWIQKLLNTRMGDHLAVDGKFGSKTQSVVKAFQSQQHIPVTGVVNSTTWHYLIVDG